MPVVPPILRLATALLFIGTAGALRADDPPDIFTMDLPFQSNAATPAWLGHPQTPATTFATLNLPIVPPTATASLLVTAYFQEKTGGFLRIVWQGGSENAQLLSDNFYEGIGMSNQRSLLISPDTMQAGGMLTFQCGDTTLGVQRIRLQWLENQNGLVSPGIQDTLVTPSLGATQPAENLNGQPKPADSPTWRDQLVVVPVTDSPQRIEQGVEYSVQLDAIPATGRLSLQEDGLPWGQHLVVWINRQRAGTVAPEVPDLDDDGYLADAGSNMYVGWRNGSLFVPVSFSKTGINTVQFSTEDDAVQGTGTAAPAIALPLAVKDVMLQLNYPEPVAIPAYPVLAPGPADPPLTDISTPGAAAAPPPDSSTTTPSPAASNTPPAPTDPSTATP